MSKKENIIIIYHRIQQWTIFIYYYNKIKNDYGFDQILGHQEAVF